MKKFALLAALAWCGFSFLAPALSADTPTVLAPATDTPTAAAPADEAPQQNGYTIYVKIHVSETGKTEGIDFDPSEDRSAQGIISRLALTLAAQAKMAVRQKDGHPIKYSVMVPYFFAVEDDEGPAANDQPKPTGIGKSVQKIVYPAAEAARNEVGGVVVELVIDTEGNVSRLTTLRATNPAFEKAVRDSVSQWKFHPAMKDGKPIETRWRYSVTFETANKIPDVKWFLTPRPSMGNIVCFYDNNPHPAAPAAGAPGAAPAPTAGAPASAPAAPAEAAPAQPTPADPK